MTNLFYCNINSIRDDEIGSYLRLLPSYLHEEVTRCIFAPDQKSKLIARLMLQKSMEHTGNTDLIHRLKKDGNNKPFVEGWHSFNISHSGDLVVLAYGKDTLGVDIEKRLALNYEEMMEFFHPREKEYILSSEDIRFSFYEIWVKKEAVLKAIGTGIVNGLKEFDCIHPCIHYQGRAWYFHPIRIHEEYTSYLCCPSKDDPITVSEYIPGKGFIVNERTADIKQQLNR